LKDTRLSISNWKTSGLDRQQKVIFGVGNLGAVFFGAFILIF